MKRGKVGVMTTTHNNGIALDKKHLHLGGKMLAVSTLYMKTKTKKNIIV